MPILKTTDGLNNWNHDMTLVVDNLAQIKILQFHVITRRLQTRLVFRETLIEIFQNFHMSLLVTH